MPLLTSAELPGTESMSVSLYEQDYQLWLEQTLAQLRLGDLQKIDLASLIEEIADLGKSEKRAIASYLMRLCEHLLKVAYWQGERDRCFRTWDVEITNFRIQIAAILSHSPSLHGFLHESFATEYSNGRELLLKASGLPPEVVPEQPQFLLEQALDEQCMPWTPDR